MESPPRIVSPGRYYPVHQATTTSFGVLPQPWDHFHQKTILKPRNTATVQSAVRIAKPDSNPNISALWVQNLCAHHGDFLWMPLIVRALTCTTDSCKETNSVTSFVFHHWYKLRFCCVCMCVFGYAASIIWTRTWPRQTAYTDSQSLAPERAYSVCWERVANARWTRKTKERPLKDSTGREGI